MNNCHDDNAKAYNRRKDDVIIGEAVVETQFANDKHDANADKGDQHA